MPIRRAERGESERPSDAGGQEALRLAASVGYLSAARSAVSPTDERAADEEDDAKDEVDATDEEDETEMV